ncbi:MAG: Gfo/Idh/MocA family oxidoreductase [Nanoarchaeota archaeon]
MTIPIKVAVIGVGSMGENHARVYAYCEKTQLVAVADSNKEQAEKIAKKFNVRAYSDYKEMLEKEKLDAVSIVVPTSLHKEVAVYVFKKGVNVLLEKPIAQTEEEAKEIIECAKENKVKLMIGHIERFNPAIIELKKKLEQKDLGEIYKIDVQRIGPFPHRISDVGVIIDLSVHDLDIIDYLINSLPSRIYAETQQKLHPHHEDSVTALLSYQNGTLAVLNINYLSPTKTRVLKIFGEKGMFKVDYLNQELYFYENKSFVENHWNSVTEGDMKKINVEKKEPLQIEIESFLNHISENTSPLVGGEQGLNVLNIARMLIKSATEKKIIELN